MGFADMNKYGLCYETLKNHKFSSQYCANRLAQSSAIIAIERFNLLDLFNQGLKIDIKRYT